MTKVDKANQKSLSLHMRLLQQKLTDFVIHMPKIFTLSNVTKKGREKILDYINELIGLKLEV